MMEIGVMSDSHGDCAAVQQAVALAGAVQLWLHAGDLCSDAAYLAQCSDARVISVAGNCDGLAAQCPDDEFFEVAGKKFWLTHGHRVRVKFGLDELISRAGEFGVDAVIYGHTHVVDISRRGKLLVLNPGSVARPRYTKASFMKLTVTDGEIVPQLIEIS